MSPTVSSTLRAATLLATWLLAVALLAAGAGAGATAATAATGTARPLPVAPHPAPTGSGDWTVYHGDPAGSGDVTAHVDLSSLRAVWRSPALDGQLYGEPLVVGGSVDVATEDDWVYALSSSTGRVRWRRHVATAVPSGDLPCGDVSPTVGVTGTPVVDVARHELFVVADEVVAGRPEHWLYGLGLGGGQVELRQRVDPPGSDPAALLQRTGLTLDRGDVVFGLGGNYGDCGRYHGWVVSVPEVGGTAQRFEVDAGPGESQGAVWMGGAAPVVDADGDVWVATGNGSVTSPSGPYDDGDSVLELSPSLRLLQSFAPSNWYRLNAGDLDLGSVSPALLPDGTVVQGGKGHTLYLLRRSRLGGLGGQIDRRSGVCASGIDGGTAVTGDVAYLPCQSGLLSVRVDAATGRLAVRWRCATGAGGPPIVAGGLVWTIAGGTLLGLDPATGAAVEQLAVGTGADHFPTPSVGDGLLLAAGGDAVTAFGPPGALSRRAR
ncbi:MAG: outer membrane protein assembly factor BamB family protein [Acidimicrobiales bacterium]